MLQLYLTLKFHGRQSNSSWMACCWKMLEIIVVFKPKFISFLSLRAGEGGLLTAIFSGAQQFTVNLSCYLSYGLLQRTLGRKSLLTSIYQYFYNFA